MENTVKNDINLVEMANGDLEISYKRKSLGYTALVLFSLLVGGILVQVFDHRGWETYLISVLIVATAFNLIINFLEIALSKLKLIPSRKIIVTHEGIDSGNHRVPFKDIDTIGVKIDSSRHLSRAYIKTHGKEIPITINTPFAEKIADIILKKARKNGFNFD